MRIAEQIAAAQQRRKAIVTGENLGQVASQTMEAMASTQAVMTLPVLRPLIGMDKEEISRAAQGKIGTFETSILPYEDCCTVFTPRHPRTTPEDERGRAARSRSWISMHLSPRHIEGIERIELDYEQELRY